MKNPFAWFFRTKEATEYTQEIESLLLTILKFPEKVSKSQEAEFISVAQQIAKRCAKSLSKIQNLEPKTVDALQGKLYFIETATAYAPLRTQAQIAMHYTEELQKVAVAKQHAKEQIEQLAFKRGELHTYTKIVGEKEFECIAKNKALVCGKPEAPVNAFVAPPSFRRFFSEELSKKAARDIYALMGGKESPKYILTFRTNVKPHETGITPVKNLPKVKFPSGTPIEIVDTRNV
jgi:hypothetical protein